jgi:WD40 repeat protein/DNA-binding SARP family transcriptional activator
MRVGILGPLVVDGSTGRLSPRDRVVLSVLVLHAREVIEADRFADALWGDDQPASSGKVVQGCVMRIRKLLGSATIITEPGGYRLALGDDDVDLHRFERLLGRAREELALRAPDRALRTTEEALALWRGRPFDDVEGWGAARFEAARLDELRLEAEELEVDATLRAGRANEVLATARALVDAAPTRERRWELLALAQYRSGSQADALRTLHAARRGLAAELGLDPGPGLVELEAAILRHDAALQGPTIPPVVDDSCPWPGLLAYAIGDADGFAGRDCEVDACLARLRDDGVLVVVGPSGSGKSSLVRAGVAGTLQRGGRSVVVLTPGARPTDALARKAPGDGCVLVIDQCEEVATACDDPFDRDAFLTALAAHAERAPLVISLRADRLGDLSGHPAFARLVERGLFLLGPMDERALRAAIEQPARAAGLLLEPGLVDLIVRDVLDEPGALPLMSHALQQTWTRREGRTLTVAAYTETGGIRGAVAQSAESVYAGVGIDEQRKLRDLFLRLVTPVEDGAPARIRLPHRAIADDPGYRRLVDQLVDARLLTTDGEVIELAHEALARAWPRFRDWLDEDVEGLRVLRHLNGATAAWDGLGRPESELYRGERLAGVLAWRERSAPDLTALEEAFVAASVERQRAELRAAEVQVEQERQANRRLRRLVAVVGVFAVVAVLATALALRQRDQADEQAGVAEARRIAAEALEARPYDRALLLAVEAVRRWDDPETRGALLTTIGRSPRIAGMIRSEGAQFVDLDVSPSGSRMVTSDDDGVVTIFDLGTRQVVDTLSTGAVVRRAPTYSPDGESVAMTSRLAALCTVTECDPAAECSVVGCASDGHAVEVRDADDLSADPVRFVGLEFDATNVVWSPDGTQLAAAVPFASNERLSVPIAVWDVDHPEEPRHLLEPRFIGADFRPTPFSETPAWLAFAPDGRTLYASGAGPVTVLDLDSGAVRSVIDGLGGLALSRDGTTMAVRSNFRAVRLVDVATGASTVELAGHDDIITTAVFSADGTVLATASTDETIGIWDVVTGDRIASLTGHAGSINDLVFDADASALYSAAADRSLVTWDLDGTDGITTTLAAASLDLPRDSTVLVDGAGRNVAVLLERSMQLLDVETGEGLDVPSVNGNTALGATFSPDGERIVSVDWTGKPRLWRTDDGELLATGEGRQDGNVGAISFSTDGRTVLLAGVDGVITEFDGETMERTGRVVELAGDDPPIGLRTAPDGRFAVTREDLDALGSTTVAFGDVDDGTVTREVRLDALVVRASFSADGSRYAWGGHDGSVGVIDVESGDRSGPADPVHTGPVSSVAFSPDGDTLATLGFDGIVTLSSADDSQPRARIAPGPTNTNGAITYGPDGHTVIVVYRDGTALSFDTDPATWTDHACAVAGRDFTAAEWRDAFGDQPRRPTC